ncbi:MAG: 3-hydroxylacyl-ACP dehydratase [Treponema sp.]|jgi:predicted hotdog family 3-hydroxylacyl-ACP dehydratase|nr:3-hydroxylacyl-ACP dehydratase [Treponema sp.]
MIEGSELFTLVPHKGKMLLLSRIIEYDLEKRTLKSEYDIEPSCIFYDPDLGGVPSWTGFEFMAQSISALSGFSARMKGEPPKVGVIMSVSNIEFFHPVIAHKAVIEIAEEVQLDKIFTFNCAVYSGDTLSAKGQLTVMDIDNVETLRGRK